jgi:predicted acetyltransferase
LIEQRQGRGLEDWQVPQTTLWLVLDQREVIGISRLRHRLTARLRQQGGHIGFVMRPSRRRQGIGRTLLGMTLGKARALGLDRVLISCDADNIGSRRVIETNGGQLEAEAVCSETGRLIRRYWIELVR